MRRLFPLISLLGILAVASFGQMRGGFRGGFHAPSFRSGRMGFPHANFGFGHRGFNVFRGRFFSPFTYPIFWDWGWGSGWDSPSYPYYANAPQPNVIVIYPQAQPVAPVVLAQPTTSATPRYGVPQEAPAPDPDPAAPVFSLAFKDHSVARAAAYWVTGPTLHYVTTEGKHYAIPLNQVDRTLSLELNRAGGVAFGLPQL